MSYIVYIHIILVIISIISLYESISQHSLFVSACKAPEQLRGRCGAPLQAAVEHSAERREQRGQRLAAHRALQLPLQELSEGGQGE